MSTLLNSAHDFLRSLGCNEEEIQAYESSSVALAEEISFYAHRNAKRENGKGYFTHPFNCLAHYRNLVGIKENDYFCISRDLMAEFNLPFEGVQEVCLLHDVVEDTDITLEEIQEAYRACDLNSYFQIYIGPALALITHNEEDSYDEYLAKCIKNPISALVKMLDLSDNMNMFGSNALTDKEFNRTLRYANYFKQINDVWHFIENIVLYNKAFALQNK
jgi:hypothetical protein